MLSVVYVTNRGPFPLVGEAPLGQFWLLSESLKAQTHQDYELVVVDRDNEHQPVLSGLGRAVTYARPRETPWTRRGAFCAASARNAGLALARGDLVLGLDDCTSFGPDLLERAAASYARGTYLAPTCMTPQGTAVCLPDGLRRGGVLCYPRAFAVQLGGHEERFDGTVALEDWEFSDRLSRRGVEWDDDPEAKVVLHQHGGRPGTSAAEEGPLGYHRCPYAVLGLTLGQPRANVPWTPEQLDVFAAPRCPLLDERENCKAQRALSPNLHPSARFPCNHGTRPDAETLAIMRGYESGPFSPFT